MVGSVAVLLGDIDERRMEALVDQESHAAPRRERAAPGSALSRVRD
jgi:hypothetical protein